MPDSWIPTFIAAHPWCAFLMAWPIALVLVVTAALASSFAETVLTTIVQLLNLAANTAVLLFRGYAPQSVEAARVAQAKGEPVDDAS